jgi:hypothetical protein
MPRLLTLNEVAVQARNTGLTDLLADVTRKI